MTKINDDGSAFPHVDMNAPVSSASTPCTSLRDWFAGLAMQALLSNSHDKIVKVFSKHGESADVAFAESAYSFADAMLKARFGKT